MPAAQLRHASLRVEHLEHYADLFVRGESSSFIRHVVVCIPLLKCASTIDLLAGPPLGDM